MVPACSQSPHSLSEQCFAWAQPEERLQGWSGCLLDPGQALQSTLLHACRSAAPSGARPGSSGLGICAHTMGQGRSQAVQVLGEDVRLDARGGHSAHIHVCPSNPACEWLCSPPPRGAHRLARVTEGQGIGQREASLPWPGHAHWTCCKNSGTWGTGKQRRFLSRTEIWRKPLKG